jgi:hypothetical protein
MCQDIRSLRDLTPDSVRDILRASLRDPTLTLTNMGSLQDMSGTNDAFNSSICSLEVRRKNGKKTVSPWQTFEVPSANGNKEAYAFQNLCPSFLAFRCRYSVTETWFETDNTNFRIRMPDP